VETAAEDGDQRQQQQQQQLTTKRLKVADEEKQPSLLLRMGAQQQQRRSPAGRSGGRQGPKSKSPTVPTPVGTPDLSVGISIKGAARTRPHPHSLLERIQGEGN
jgi:hypothetical protein